MEDFTSQESDVETTANNESPVNLEENPSGELFDFVKNLNEIIFIVDDQRNVVVLSDTARAAFGVRDDDNQKRSIEYYLPKVYIDAISQRNKDEDSREMQLTFPAKNGKGNEILLETRFNWFQKNGENLMSVTCRDVNDYMQMLNELIASEDRYRTIFRKSPIGFIHVNSDGIIIDCNDAFLKIFGFEKFEVSGVCLAEENNLNIYPRFKKAAMNAVVGIDSRHEAAFTSNDGTRKGWVRVSFSPVISENNSFLGAVGIVEDITESKKAADKINFVSSHDTLTGLLNRRAYEEAQLAKDSAEYLPIGIIYADLNCLKLANDAFGHHDGDILLQAAASILRDNAGDDGEAFRLGGDEFILIITNTTVDEVADRVKNITEACRNWKGNGLVSPSMALGSSVKIFADQKLEVIAKEAEDLMYANKLRFGKPTRMKILGSLENRLHSMVWGSVGLRSKRMMQWGEWIAGNPAIRCERDMLIPLCRYHDIGLLAYPEEISVISNDPRKEHVVENFQHMATGYRIAKCTPEIAGIAERILSHHEWWDGMGYPNQLEGEEIPLESRITFIFDSLESLITLGSNGQRMAFEEAWAAIKACAGKQFDPYLVDIISLMIKENPPKFLMDPEC